MNGEIRRYEEEREGFVTEAKEAKADAEKKRHDIEEIKRRSLRQRTIPSRLEQALKEHTARREEMSAEYKGFFQKREDISKKISDLDKEIFRLNSQREKLEEAHEYQNNYMWEEYEPDPACSDGTPQRGIHGSCGDEEDDRVHQGRDP